MPAGNVHFCIGALQHRQHCIIILRDFLTAISGSRSVLACETRIREIVILLRVRTRGKDDHRVNAAPIRPLSTGRRSNCRTALGSLFGLSSISKFWSISRPMARQVLPAPTGEVLLPDVPNWSWHEYGMRVGVWRFFDLFARLGIRPTLSINARVCREYRARRSGGARCRAGSSWATPGSRCRSTRSRIRRR